MTDPRQPAGDPPVQRSITLDDILHRPDSGRDLRRLPALIRRAFGLVWRSAPREFAVSTVLQVVAGVSLGAQLLIAKRLIDQLLGGNGAVQVSDILVELVLFSILLLVIWMAGIIRAEQQRLIGQLVERYTTGQVMGASTSVPLVKYDDPDFYNQLQRARMNASSRPIQIVNGLLGLLQSVPAALAVSAVLIFIQPLILLILIAGAAPAVILNRIGARIIHAHQVKHTPGDRLRMYLYQALTRKEEAHEVRAFHSSPYLRDRHDSVFDDRIRDLRVAVRKRMILGFIGALVTVLVIASTLILTLALVAKGQLDLASAGVALGAIVILSGKLRGILSSIASLYEGSLFLEDFTAFIDRHPPEPTQGPYSPVHEGGTGSVFSEIEFDHVSFTYPSRSEPSLNDISLKVRRGEVIALVGENGSGKTTLAKLMAGLYMPTAGEVRWDGVDVKKLNKAVIRDNVAVIFQDYARYFFTARENIGIGDKGRITNEAAIMEAAHRAGIDDFLSTLPHGLNTILGPAFLGGTDLSGGQWQRIALARAHFRDSPLLILDEPTASLDPRGEYQVFEQVRRLAKGRTVIFISHRFSSARSADRILVLDQGHLVEEGSHDELTARGGLYAELFSLQARSYSEPIR